MRRRLVVSLPSETQKVLAELALFSVVKLSKLNERALRCKLRQFHGLYFH